jgi:hypothetical protein
LEKKELKKKQQELHQVSLSDDEDDKHVSTATGKKSIQKKEKKSKKGKK